MKKAMVALVAGGCLALNAPVAQAEHATLDCNPKTFYRVIGVTGPDVYTAFVHGYILSSTPGEFVSIRCYVRVDGSEVASTPRGSGVNQATTAGQVTFTASDTQDIDLCAEWTAGSESGEVCWETTSTHIPPREVYDVISQIMMDVIDPIVCPLLITVGEIVLDVPGVVEINSEGDVFLLGEPFWDCPPYEW